jgi:hypothetical protein
MGVSPEGTLFLLPLPVNCGGPVNAAISVRLFLRALMGKALFSEYGPVGWRPPELTVCSQPQMHQAL